MAATPLFNSVDVVVLVGFAATIAEIIRSRGGAVPLCAFAITAHLYAYNFIAMVSESGLEAATIWLLIDPVAAVSCAPKPPVPAPIVARTANSNTTFPARMDQLYAARLDR